MSNLVRIIDNISGSVLFETTVVNINEAYAFAALMEKEGIDFNFEAPGMADTLLEDKDDFGCLICPPSSRTQK